MHILYIRDTTHYSLHVPTRSSSLFMSSTQSLSVASSHLFQGLHKDVVASAAKKYALPRLIFRDVTKRLRVRLIAREYSSVREHNVTH